MQKTINSDLIRGNINTIILKSLYNGDRYGYDIIREIKEKSRGQYILKQPTLYSCLKRLENQGFIRGCWGEESNGGRRKYYTLTDLGREVFIKSQDEYEYSRTIIDHLISERDYDLDSVERPIDTTEYDVDLEITEASSQAKEKTKQEDVQPHPTPVTSAIDSEISRHADAITIAQDTQTGEIVAQESSTVDFDALFNSGNVESSTYSVNATTEPTSIETAVTNATGYGFIDLESAETTTQTQNAEQTTIETEQPQHSREVESIQAEVNIEPQSTQQQPQVEFIRYNTPVTQPVSPTVSRPTPVVNSSTEYRDALSSLIDGFNTPQQTPTETVAQPTQQPNADDIRAKSDLSVKEKIQVKNFGRLTESIREMGDSVKIRTKNPDAIQQYNNKYYYYKNKLALYQFGILFLVMILETFLSFVIIKRGFNINAPNDNAFYITSVILCLSLPVFAGLSYLFNPLATKRLEYNFKSSLIFRIIIALQICLITYALCVYFNMPIGGSADYALYLTIPMVLSTNIPLSTVIFNKLYKSKKFAV